MTHLLDCPESESWQALLDVDLPPEQVERMERHLQSCPACRDRLERIEGEDVLLRMARQVGDPTDQPADPTFQEFLQRLHEAKEAERNPIDLYFLQPTERPDLLGTLNGYEVQEVIGQGGMGVVLKAYEPALNRLAAIKVMAAAVAGSAVARKRFAREAKAAAAVCHENIVTIYGIHEADGLPYLVMQYVEGESLQDRLDRAGPLSAEEVVRIGMQTALGLAAAHARGLIHRDVKPANLLLSFSRDAESSERSASVGSALRSEDSASRLNQCVVKITDFGLARMIDDVALTQNGVVAGTPEYMAPEQARGEAVDHRADLFSLGSVLYAMCTGVPPFRGSTALGVLRQVSEQAPAAIRSLNPDAPAWLEGLVERLLAKDPAHRIQSAAQAAELLEAFLAHLRQPATVPAPELSSPLPGRSPEPPASGKRFGRPSWLAALLLVVWGSALTFALLAADSEKGPAPAIVQELHLPLKGELENRQDVELMGPDADRCVKFEPDGLRITLPPGYQGRRPRTGVRFTLKVKGDFEMTVNYEILQEAATEEAKQTTTPLMLLAVVDKTRGTGPGITRRIGGNLGPQFAAWAILWDKDLGKRRHPWKAFPAAADRGRLRMERRGAVVSYSVAEGPAADFTLLHEISFGEEDLQEVQIGGYTNGPGGAIDARFSDLRIRSGSLPPPSTTPAQDGAAGGWLTIVLLSILGLTLGLALFFSLRRGRRKDESSSGTPNLDIQPEPVSDSAIISFPCSACGSTLKVRAKLAGKKVQCLHCGKAAPVPEINPEQSVRPSE